MYHSKNLCICTLLYWKNNFVSKYHLLLKSVKSLNYIRMFLFRIHWSHFWDKINYGRTMGTFVALRALRWKRKFNFDKTARLNRKLIKYLRCIEILLHPYFITVRYIPWILGPWLQFIISLHFYLSLWWRPHIVIMIKCNSIYSLL